jgi:hypothetical protein
MSMTGSAVVTRVAALVAAILTAAVAFAGPAAAGSPSIPQKFYADSGDRCHYGATEGTLTWHTIGPTVFTRVYLQGTLMDRPASTEPGVCADDRMYSSASYIAYADRSIVDTARLKVDNGAVPVRDVLGDQATGSSVIDRVVVQVCRFPTAPIGISYCGSPQTYRPMWITPTG